jgi:ferredoxin
MTRRKLLGAVLTLMAGCAVSVFGKARFKMKIIAHRCVGCRDCHRICPVGAIVIHRGKANIDQTACTSCMLCESVCSYGAVERCEKL